MLATTVGVLSGHMQSRTTLDINSQVLWSQAAVPESLAAQLRLCAFWLPHTQQRVQCWQSSCSLCHVANMPVVVSSVYQS